MLVVVFLAMGTSPGFAIESSPFEDPPADIDDDLMNDDDLPREDVEHFYRGGPSAALGVPVPASVGLEVLAGRSFSAELAFGDSMGSFHSGDVKFVGRIRHVKIGIRFHPSGGAFFIGVGGGRRELRLSAEYQTSTGRTAFVTYESRTIYVSPSFGWLKEFDSGLVLGVELGALVPVSSRYRVTQRGVGDTADDGDHGSRVLDDAERLGRTERRSIVPFVNVLKLGWVH